MFVIFKSQKNKDIIIKLYVIQYLFYSKFLYVWKPMLNTKTIILQFFVQRNPSQVQQRSLRPLQNSIVNNLAKI